MLRVLFLFTFIFSIKAQNVGSNHKIDLDVSKYSNEISLDGLRGKSFSDESLDEFSKNLFWLNVYIEKLIVDFDYAIGARDADPLDVSEDNLKNLKELKRNIELARESNEIILNSGVYKSLQKLRERKEFLEHRLENKYKLELYNYFIKSVEKELGVNVGKVFTKEQQKSLNNSKVFIRQMKLLFSGDLEISDSRQESLKGVPGTIYDQIQVIGDLGHARSNLIVEMDVPLEITPRVSRQSLARFDELREEVKKLGKDLYFTPDDISKVTREFAKFIDLERASISNVKPLRAVERGITQKEVDEFETLHQGLFFQIPERQRASIEKIVIKKNSFTPKKKERNPDSGIYYPSLGSPGNIFGTKFPRNTWALTYDDGPNNGSSLKILNLLKNYGISATWFMVTSEVKKHLRSAELIRDDDMEIANHSYNHINFLSSKISDSTKRRNVFDAVQDQENLMDVNVRLFRFPYGNGQRSTKYRNYLLDRNLIHVAWNIDSLDWKDRNPRRIVNRIKNQMARVKQGVILLHDVHETTYQASKILLQELVENSNTKLCTVGAIIVEMETGKDCRGVGDVVYDISDSVENDLKDICLRLQKRVRTVQDSLLFLKDNGETSGNTCMSSAEWHRFSSPRSDDRIHKKLKALKNKHRRLGEEGANIKVRPDVYNKLDQIFGNLKPANFYCEISYIPQNSSVKVQLKHVFDAFELNTLSFNPHDNFHLRWGVQKGSPSTCTTGSRPGYYGK